MAFILITNDQHQLSLSDFTVPAIKIARFRLSQGVYPIYSRTANRDKFKINDKCIVYIAGKSEYRQNFVSFFTIKSIRELKYPKNNTEEDILKIGAPMPIKNLIFEPTDILNPIFVKNVMKKLEWTKNAKKKWGSLFMGGVKKISNKDSEILINLLKRKRKK